MSSKAKVGIGLELTKTLLAQGYAVVTVARSASKVWKNAPNLAVIDGDVGESGTAERSVAEAQERFGKLDLLVNNGGIFIAKPFTDTTSEDYERIVRTNLAGFFHMTQHALRVMAPKWSS